MGWERDKVRMDQEMDGTSYEPEQVEKSDVVSAAQVDPDVIDPSTLQIEGLPVRPPYFSVQKETIVAAAIEIEGLCISLPQPARHGHVHMAAEACGIEPDVYLPATQGFLTSTGRFVNRVMAKHIAHRAGQPQMRPEEERHQAELFSEDLW